MAMTDRMQALRDTTISPSIKWYSGKAGTNHKKKYKKISTWTASHLPHTGQIESPLALVGKQIRVLLTVSYSVDKRMWYEKNLVLSSEMQIF